MEGMNYNKKVLILGGTGNMSSCLTSLCVEAGYDVTISVRGRYHKISCPDTVKVLKFDRNEQAAYGEYLAGLSFDIVFDCSGYWSQAVRWTLQTVKCDRYVYVSSFEVYSPKYGTNIKEKSNPHVRRGYEPIITAHGERGYATEKAFSERVIANEFPEINYVILRIPFVMSQETHENASTARLFYYANAVINGIAINSRSLDNEYSMTLNGDEAKFLMYIANTDVKEVLNFASQGVITPREIVSYVEEKANMKAIFSESAENKGFGYHLPCTVNLKKCLATGYQPLNIKDWIYKLLDSYIDKLMKK